MLVDHFPHNVESPSERGTVVGSATTICADLGGDQRSCSIALVLPGGILALAGTDVYVPEAIEQWHKDDWTVVSGGGGYDDVTSGDVTWDFPFDLPGGGTEEDGDWGYILTLDLVIEEPPTTTQATTTTTAPPGPTTTTTTAPPGTTITTQPPPPPPPGLLFSDIAGDAHRENVLLVAEEGIAAGYPDGTYRPGLSVTRGQMATFLARALGLSLTGGPTFSDLGGEVHGAAIRSIAREGITTGFGDGTFRPGLPVSREQMASFLTRAFDLPITHPPFTDVSGIHAQAVGAVAEPGIAEGFGDNSYRPAWPVTRAQMATFLARALDLN